MDSPSSMRGLLVSSAACVDVLRAAGFRIAHRDEASRVLQRGARSVVVPWGDAALSAECLDQIIEASEMTREAFEALLDVAENVVRELPPSSKVASL